MLRALSVLDVRGIDGGLDGVDGYPAGARQDQQTIDEIRNKDGDEVGIDASYNRTVLLSDSMEYSMRNNTRFTTGTCGVRG